MIYYIVIEFRKKLTPFLLIIRKRDVLWKLNLLL